MKTLGAIHRILAEPKAELRERFGVRRLAVLGFYAQGADLGPLPEFLEGEVVSCGHGGRMHRKKVSVGMNPSPPQSQC